VLFKLTETGKLYVAKATERKR